jgi:hypothetical protein
VIRAKKEPQFKTEVDLCAAFIAAVSKGWTAYPETGNFDILLVRASDGYQIGIEAKLKLNVKVLVQAAESRWSAEWQSPDYRAVLVPEFGEHALSELAPHCALTVLRFRGQPPKYVHWGDQFYPSLPSESQTNSDWHELVPTKRCKLPDYVPDVAAGASAPLKLTHWKVSALYIAALLDASGYVDRGDFKRFGVDIRRWISGGWLKAENGVFVRGNYWPQFDRQHPVVWEQIKAEPKKWQRPVPLMQIVGAA